ncbi:hypothetical protein vseg_017468 [Gypsophila vaccaria]
MISHYTNPNFFSPIHQIIIKPSNFSPQKSLFYPKKPPFYPQDSLFTLKSHFKPSSAANSVDFYNGWDELRHWVDSDELGKSNYIKKIVTLLGIDDRKYVISSILGFVIALVISRVRVSSIVVFPAAVIVFGVGVSFGYVKFYNVGGKIGEKGEISRVYVEKLKSLGELFDGFDVRIYELTSCLKKGIDEERVDLSELEGYLDVLGSIGGLVSNARNVVEECGVELRETEKKSNGKNFRKKKENGGGNGFDLLGLLGGLGRGFGVESRTSKRNVLRKESIVKGVGDDRVKNDVLNSGVEGNGSSPRVSSSVGGRKIKLGERNREMERILQSDRMREMEGDIDSRSFVGDDDNGKFNYQSMRFVDNQSFSFNMSSLKEVRRWSVDDGMSSYSEFGFGKEQLEDENSWSSQQLFGKSVQGYESNGGGENLDFGNYIDSFSREEVNLDDELHTWKYQPQTQKNGGAFSSSTVSDDLLFNKYLTDANDLLKQAKECLKDGNDEMFAEEMLHKSAKLLSQAIALKPMSLLAVGQLGNTYLIHGELKLRNSRALRNRLSRNEIFGLERQDDMLSSVDEARPNKDRIATLLGNTCEECEALLVQAGRKYRTALSIDGNDVRALYNWGLALFFRAQLIADIGPEAALDADKLFLAAIDKFDAMMSRSNVYAPEALFRWGMALQQRSRLRPSRSRDKVKLLQQAKRLYADALDMGSNNLQVRKALSSCMSELNLSDV